MNGPMDARLARWLCEGPDTGPRAVLERTIELTERTRQRPGWTVRSTAFSSEPIRRTRLIPLAIVLALLVAAIGAALFAAGQRKTPPLFELRPVARDEIPLPGDLAPQVAAMVEGWGYRLERLDGDAPQPRISGEQATTVAGQELLGNLKRNGMPAQDVSVPDGRMRRLLYSPDDGSVRSVWVITFRWRSGFNCWAPSGGPGTCQSWETHLIDDRTGVRVASFSGAQ